MKTPSFVVAAIFASLFLVYDVWLIGTGLFHPGALLGVVGWMGLLMAACVGVDHGRDKPDSATRNAR